MSLLPGPGWQIRATYGALPPVLFHRQLAEVMPEPRLAVLNHPLASELGLDAGLLASDQGLAWLAGTTAIPGAVPLAMAYAGHQYGHFTMLGDGRALLIAEHLDPAGRLWDVHLKGSGRTPYSRRGDGRAALGPMLREFLVSEALHAQGIPTTRCLAVLTTGERVARPGSPPGAQVVRVAAGHVRVGTCQFAAACDDPAALPALVGYAARRHGDLPADASDDPQAAARALFAGVVERQAALVARWMAAGFVHGVMNTDNLSLSGETIDLGPCAFLDAYRPDQVFSSIDHCGRYAYANQPAIAQWNLARLAESLLPLLADDPAEALAWAENRLAAFPDRYQRQRTAVFATRLGLTAERAAPLIDGFLDYLAAEDRDYHLAWLDVLAAAEGRPAGHCAGAAWTAWRERYLAAEPDAAALRTSIPRVIPRNHQVEAVLAAAETGDWQPWDRMLAAVRTPWQDTLDAAALMTPPTSAEADGYRTFCGT